MIVREPIVGWRQWNFMYPHFLANLGNDTIYVPREKIEAHCEQYSTIGTLVHRKDHSEQAPHLTLDRLYVHEAAVSSKNGAAILKRFRGDLGTNEGMNFISEDLADSDGESVQTVCLDQFCRDLSIDHVDLLKLDVQGHEHSALKGAEHLIKAGRVGVIFMELNWARSAGARLCCHRVHSPSREGGLPVLETG